MRQPRPLFRLFLVFSNKQYIFTTNQCEKMSWPSSIWHQDSNPWPLNFQPTLAIYFEVGAFFIAFVNGEISNDLYVSNTKCSHLFTLIITKVLNTVKGKNYLSLHCEKNKKRGRAWPILNQISIRKVFYFRCCTGILNANYQFKHYDENIHS